MAALIAAAAALALAACGGGGDDSTSTAAAKLAAQPAPKQPLSAQVGSFNQSIAAKDCKAYQKLVFSTVRGRPPGVRATDTECTRVPKFELLRSQFNRIGQYGTGGLMEGPGPDGRPQTTFWVVDGDGRYRFTLGSVSGRPQIGTPFTTGAKAVAVATGFLQAVRKRDCAAVERAFSSQARLVVFGGGRRAACRTILNGKILAPALRKTPKPKVVAMGGTVDLAFVGIQTRDIFFTMILGQKLRVVDVLPSTPIDLPKT